MNSISLRPDCLAIATEDNETLWVRSDPTDIKSLLESFKHLSASPAYLGVQLHPLRSYTDAHGNERLVELFNVPVSLALAMEQPSEGVLPSTTKVQVWHDKEPTFGFGPKVSEVCASDFAHVADLHVKPAPADCYDTQDLCRHAMNQAFELTQNLDHGWHPRGMRSTSVGDIFVVELPTGKEVFRVASFGFDKVAFKV